MPTYNSKFISTVFLKENTTIEDNVDDTKLVPFIKISQDTHIGQVLGATFYNRLKEGVALNNLNSDETDLMKDYIQPCLAQFAYYEVYPFLNFKTTNKAISKESSEFSQPSELDEIKYMRNAIRDLAEFYLKRLSRFLCDFSDLFPEYQNPDPKDNLPKNSKAYFNGVYVQRRGGWRNLGVYSEDYRTGSGDFCEGC
jgi:hypothetical protein